MKLNVKTAMDVKKFFQTIHVTCLFDNNEDWIERFYDEIISKLDVGLIHHIFYKLPHTSPHTSIFVELNKVDV